MGLQCNGHHPRVFLSTKVWLERLSAPYERECFGIGAAKRVKAAIEIDVVHDRCASRREGGPRVVQLEYQIALGVPAVVYEQVDRSDFGQEWAEPSSTRARDVRP